MKATSHGEGFYHGHLFLLNTIKLWLIGTNGGDDWSRFEINMTSVFLGNLAKRFFAWQQQQEQQ